MAQCWNTIEQELANPVCKFIKGFGNCIKEVLIWHTLIHTIVHYRAKLITYFFTAQCDKNYYAWKEVIKHSVFRFLKCSACAKKQTNKTKTMHQIPIMTHSTKIFHVSVMFMTSTVYESFDKRELSTCWNHRCQLKNDDIKGRITVSSTSF